MLPGTEQAAFPFWSPDSQAIAYFTPGKLQRIALSGGPAVPICPAPQAAFGGSWSSTGDILFSQRLSGRLWRVRTAGGPALPATRVKREQGEIAHIFPVFLPDGHRFLYSVIRRGLPSLLALGELDSTGSKDLTESAPGAAYFKNVSGGAGTLLFSYNGALMSQRFEEARGNLAGSAVPIAAEVRHVGQRAELSVSSRGAIAYQTGGEKERQLTWLGRDGREVATVGPRNAFTGLSLSPDGTRIAVEAPDSTSGRPPGIWIIDAVHGAVSRMENAGKEGLSPVWSPGGRELVYSTGAPEGLSLVRQGLEQRDSSRIADGPGVRAASDWSGDGKLVAYNAAGPTSPALAVRIASVDGQAVAGSSHQQNHNECCAVFAPSNRWLAYCSDETGQYEVFIEDLPARERKWQVSASGGSSPHWRADGRELFYLAPNGRMMAAAIDGTNTLRVGVAQFLFDSTILPDSYPVLPGNQYAVSPDGQRFLVNRAVRKTPAQSITISLPVP